MDYPKVIEVPDCTYNFIDNNDKFVLYDFITSYGITGWSLIKADFPIDFSDIDSYGKNQFTYVSKDYMYSEIKRMFDIDYLLPEDRIEDTVE